MMKIATYALLAITSMVLTLAPATADRRQLDTDSPWPITEEPEPIDDPAPTTTYPECPTDPEPECPTDDDEEEDTDKMPCIERFICEGI